MILKKKQFSKSLGFHYFCKTIWFPSHCYIWKLFLLLLLRLHLLKPIQQGRIRSQGDPGVPMTPLCKPTTGDKSDMKICWETSFWHRGHRVTPPLKNPGYAPVQFRIYLVRMTLFERTWKRVSWCMISWFYLPWNLNLGNYSSWSVTWRFCGTREELELFTDIRDFTTVFYAILITQSEPPKVENRLPRVT